MRFNIDGKLFQQQLQAVNKVINAKNALSILDNFLFELEGDKLTIPTATALWLSLQRACLK